jgi:hypothetical protein
MADAPTPPDPNLKAEFDRARAANDFATMQRVGVRLYPEPAGALDVFASRGMAPSRPGIVGEAAPSGPRAALETHIAELRHGPVLEPARQRDARLAELGRLQEELYAPTRATTHDPSRDPVDALAAKEEWTAEDRGVAERAGVTVVDWPESPRGWDGPVVDAVAAQVIGRGITADTLVRWAARGLALSQEEPAPAPLDLPRAIIADAQLALRAFLPEPTLRARVVEWLGETGLANDAAFIRELAARGRPLREELAHARAERLALSRMNPGSREDVALADSIAARYRRIYAESPMQIRGGTMPPHARGATGERADLRLPELGPYAAALRDRLTAAYDGRAT